LKIANTNLSKYGHISPLANPNVRNKSKQTNLERYGYEHAMQSSDIQAKAKETNLERYGVEYTTQNPDIMNSIVASRVKNHYSPEVYDKINDPEWLRQQNESVTLLEISQSLGVLPHNLSRHYAKFDIPVKYHSTTALERKFVEYFTTNGINFLLKDRSIISPKEIDIVLPDIKLGIEINGGYYHSDEFRNKNYHLNKTIAVNEAGYTLWHFWDWELNQNWDLIISKIENALSKSKRSYARKLEIKYVSFSEKEIFLEQNHIQGSSPSSINIGLYSNDQLLMIGTFGKSRYAKKENWELLRLASKRGHSVVGGASRIMKFFLNHIMNVGDSLISYCHRRFSSGNVYTKLGFTLSHTTAPGYTYVRRGLPVGSRVQWQKHKLKGKLAIFDENLSANLNMKINGYYRVWDCGQYVFILTK
jgi:very-short-patch-repair endonuclease